MPLMRSPWFGAWEIFSLLLSNRTLVIALVLIVTIFSLLNILLTWCSRATQWNANKLLLLFIIIIIIIIIIIWQPIVMNSVSSANAKQLSLWSMTIFIYHFDFHHLFIIDIVNKYDIFGFYKIVL